MKYRSVIGFGTAEILEDPDSRQAALTWMMGQYSERKYSLPEETVRNTCVIRVRIEQISGKRAL
jgi:nitroimidazol reductase NimA-like FMN-containing flavoprotein (pyridoxamine 5'-phosphate oxidase superfamily)